MPSNQIFVNPAATNAASILVYGICYRRIGDSQHEPTVIDEAIDGEFDTCLECDCQDDAPCVQIVGYAPGFFGTVKLMTYLGCVEANIGQGLPPGQFDGILPTAGPNDCNWQKAGWYNVNYPPAYAWQIGVVVYYDPSDHLWKIHVGFSISAFSGTAEYTKSGGDTPEGTYTYNSAYSPLFNDPSCYLMSPTTITIEYC